MNSAAVSDTSARGCRGQTCVPPAPALLSALASDARLRDRRVDRRVPGAIPGSGVRDEGEGIGEDVLHLRVTLRVEDPGREVDEARGARLGPQADRLGPHAPVGVRCRDLLEDRIFDRRVELSGRVEGRSSNEKFVSGISTILQMLVDVKVEVRRMRGITRSRRITTPLREIRRCFRVDFVTELLATLAYARRVRLLAQHGPEASEERALEVRLSRGSCRLEEARPQHVENVAVVDVDEEGMDSVAEPPPSVPSKNRPQVRSGSQMRCRHSSEPGSW